MIESWNSNDFLFRNIYLGLVSVASFLGKNNLKHQPGDVYLFICLALAKSKSKTNQNFVDSTKLKTNQAFGKQNCLYQ